MPDTYRQLSSGRNLRKLCLANALNFHFSVKSRITSKQRKEGASRNWERGEPASGMQNLKNTHTHTQNQSESWLDFCLSVSGCVCAPKNFCHELRLGKMCEKNISKQSKSDARAIENFSHRLAEEKSSKKKRKQKKRGNPRKIIIENANASMHLSLSGRGRQAGRRTKSKPKRKSSKCQLPNDILLLPRPLSPAPPL